MEGGRERQTDREIQRQREGGGGERERQRQRQREREINHCGLPVRALFSGNTEAFHFSDRSLYLAVTNFELLTDWLGQ